MYRDINGHFTSEENDGGECLHSNQNIKPTQKKSHRFIPKVNNSEELVLYVKMVLNTLNTAEHALKHRFILTGINLHISLADGLKKAKNMTQLHPSNFYNILSKKC